MTRAEILDMASDPDEREALTRLSERLERSGDVALESPPADLRARVLATGGPAPAAPPTPPRRRWAMPEWFNPRQILAGAAVGAAAVAIAIAAWPSSPDGQFEGGAQLTGRGDTALVEVRKTGIGRVVELDSTTLPVLPEGRYYELWFVGSGDRPGRPNRISAGTFHPDPQGRSRVTLKAAVDPAKYPRLEITAEPGDGDPRATGPVALRGRLP